MSLGAKNAIGRAAGVAIGASLLAFSSLSACNAQAPAGNSSTPRLLVSSSAPVAPGAPAASPLVSTKVVPAQAVSEQFGREGLVREIDDPHTGDRWLLVRDPGRPGAPGRLVLAPAAPRQPGSLGASLARSSQESQPLPVIHTGDRLIVVENTALARARLEAVALGPAWCGSPLKVRLAIGGVVVDAVALGPGLAAFALEIGARP